jgi:hypothetical protein
MQETAAHKQVILDIRAVTVIGERYFFFLGKVAFTSSAKVPFRRFGLVGKGLMVS